MLVDQTLTAFAAATASRSPTPGGGSVSACVGAFGAALGAMAARFSEGRKGLESHASQLADEIARLDALREDFLELVELDSRAYDKVTAAYALPKATDAEKAARKEAIQTALVAAIEAPLRTCRSALAGLELLHGLVGHVNPNLGSDVAVGAYGLGAAWRGAWVNVLINVAQLSDRARRDALLAEGAAMEAKARQLEDEVSRGIVGALRSG